MQTKQFLVFGRVQGVGFRFFTLQQAGKIGLKGRVRNRQDGSVEIIAQGNEDQLIQLKTWLKTGPKTARIERIIELDFETSQQLETFEIQH